MPNVIRLMEDTNACPVSLEHVVRNFVRKDIGVLIATNPVSATAAILFATRHMAVFVDQGTKVSHSSTLQSIGMRNPKATP